MDHWSDFLCFAVCHGEAMKYTQVQIDGAQLLQAIAQAQAQAQQARNLLAPGFDPRLIRAS